MQHQHIIDAIKKSYTRDLRKQIVKSLIKHEKDNDKEAIESSHKILNQIFSYIISELGWTFSQNSSEWDNTPLQIMGEVFPNIDSTKWFGEKLLSASSSVELKGEF